MTVIIGALCVDGVVVGADSAVTFGNRHFNSIRQKTRKISIVADRLIIAGSGYVGHNQRAVEVIEEAWDAGQFKDRTSPIAFASTAGGLVRRNLIETQSPPDLYSAVLAFPFKRKPFLCEFEGQGFQPELKTDKLWFTSLGCGTPIADPVLAFLRRVIWRDKQPTVAEGILSVAWTLDHCCQVNPGGIAAPFDIAVLQGDNARALDQSEIGSHMEAVEGFENYIADYRDIMKTPVQGGAIPAPAAGVS